MDSDKHSEMTSVTEGFATNFTFVRLLACVDERVSFEMTIATE